MTSFTTLVNVDAESANKVALFVSQLLADGQQQYFNECVSLIESAKTAELIAKLLSQSDLILALERESAVDGCFQSIFSLIYTLGDNEKNEVPIVKSVVASLTSSNNQARLRLQALVTLFNIVFSGETKFEVMNAIFNYSRANNLTGVIGHFFNKFEEWVSTWGVTADQQRTLLKSIAMALEQEGQHSSAFKALIRYFKTFGATNAKYPADVEPLILNALLHAIKSPINAFADRTALLEAFASASFATAGLSGLVELLKIICDGSLEDFQKFSKANAALFTSHKLDVTQFEHTVKLLTLCSLAAQATNKTLTYASVQAALQIDESEVEMWAVEAISENLLEATIDQLNSTITINRYSHRSFGPAHWKAVQAKLRALRKNMSGVNDAFQRNKAVAAM